MESLKTWLITGGAGYIGSHIVRDFLKAGIEIIVLDNLSTGKKDKIPSSVKFYETDILNKNDLQQIFLQNRIEGVIHLAAKKSVIESMKSPNFYFEQNVLGLSTLLSVMKTNQIKNIVFSSSSSVYGNPANELSRESDILNPISFYGKTKLMGEWIIESGAEWGLNAISLRYFNVAGAGEKKLKDVGEFNLIPMVFRAILDGENPKIFGDNYETLDGTCIRDFVHVEDVSHAHLLCAQKLSQGFHSEVFNVGTGSGYSVREVIEKIRKITGRSFEIEIMPARDGDPAITGAETSKISSVLGWEAQRGIDEIISSAWTAWSQE